MSGAMGSKKKGTFPAEVKDAQSLLARYCLDKDRRIPRELSLSNRKALRHYRRLIHNIFEDCLERAFPLAFGFLKGTRWDRLIKDFVAKHDCKTPQLMRTPYEFYLFAKERFDGDQARRFLIELFYFEWLEIELHLMPDIPLPVQRLSQKYSRKRVIAINPEHRVLLLKHPFHRLPPAKAQKIQGAYHLLLFRCPDTGEVSFLQINAIFAWVIGALSKEDHGLSTEHLIALLIESLGDKIEKAEDFSQKIEGFIIDLHHRNMIRGFF